MANKSVKDRSSAINPSDVVSSDCSSNPAPLDPSELKDHVEDSLSKAKALTEAALLEGVTHCSITTQHQYFAVLDDLLAEMKSGLDQLR